MKKTLFLVSLFASHFSLFTSPFRIASVALGSDEILLDLLYAINEPHRIMGLSKLAGTRYSAVPTSPNLALFESDLETLVKAQPDLIFYSQFNHPNFIKGISVFSKKSELLPYPKTIKELKKNYLTISQLLDRPDALGFLGLNNPLPQPKWMRGKVIAHFSENGYTPGSNTLFHDLMVKMGAISYGNSLGLSGYPQVNREVWTKTPPDFIVTSLSLDQVKKLASWQSLVPILNDRIIHVPNSTLESVSKAFLGTAQYLANFQSPT